MKSKLWLAVLPLLVAGCTGNVKPGTHVVYAQATVVCDVPTGVDRLQMEPVEFHAITGKKVSGGPTVNWIGLTPAGYEALGRNIQRILIQSKQSAAVIKYYESCIQSANNAVTTSAGQVPDKVQEQVKTDTKALKPAKAEEAKSEAKPASDKTPTDLEDPNSKKFWQFWKDNA